MLAANHDSIDELASGGGVLVFVSVKQGQIGGPLETVMRCESIPEIGSLRLLLLIGYFEAASFSPFFSLYCFRLFVLQVQYSNPAAATNFVQLGFSMSNLQKVQLNTDLFSNLQKYLYTVEFA
jgi:hypothetical protein